MKLKELLKNLPGSHVIGNADIPVRGITYDSRQVNRDFIFAAVKGQHLDGRAFVKDALARGASAVILEEAFGDLNAVQIIVPDAREAMARVAAAFYGEPCRNMTLIGVTGTNGKTTITYLVESILRTAGFNAGVVGTINYRYRDKIFNAPHTTPEAPDLQRIFRAMLDSGVTHCVMEVSSHSLAQKRVFGSRIVGGVFTNLTQDHLDYHKTMEEYFESKSMLFTDFVAREKDGFAVINTDDPWGLKLKTMFLQVLSRDQNSKLKTIGYSLNSEAEIKPAKASFSEKGIEASLNTPIGAINISSALLGEYNLQNIMAAVGVGIGLALDKKTIEKGIAALKRVPGRLERIISEDGFQAVVDYAHTGDALERVIGALKPLAKKRLITVFGCGGDRDRGKRPVMGEIAARLSDFTVITSDNPRSEDPMEIIKEIEAGINKGVRGQGSGVKRSYTIIPDRHEAIMAAVNLAAAGDIILVAGKGHEDYQIIGYRNIPFEDTKEIKAAMEVKYRSQ
ncbi:MAG TPA: UDP-N-acetylmuramoyl-L-alanyl-D-glutamate--2,6-diaminopimelate ligase [Thermodesulfobacteriota bacterium]|nr:UDP-N-acetylmuramoyl-L-alanyl-D-glutamate--2,6-diaminopimelate ligase [Thermodesulfobacteriota bacterium]